MSKPHSNNVSPTEFEKVFGFTPCTCHKRFWFSEGANYKVKYETLPSSTIIKNITIICQACGMETHHDVTSMNIDVDSLPF